MSKVSLIANHVILMDGKEIKPGAKFTADAEVAAFLLKPSSEGAVPAARPADEIIETPVNAPEPTLIEGPLPEAAPVEQGEEEQVEEAAEAPVKGKGKGKGKKASEDADLDELVS